MDKLWLSCVQALTLIKGKTQSGYHWSEIHMLHKEVDRKKCPRGLLHEPFLKSFNIILLLSSTFLCWLLKEKNSESILNTFQLKYTTHVYFSHWSQQSYSNWDHWDQLVIYLVLYFSSHFLQNFFFSLQFEKRHNIILTTRNKLAGHNTMYLIIKMCCYCRYPETLFWKTSTLKNLCIHTCTYVAIRQMVTKLVAWS